MMDLAVNITQDWYKKSAKVEVGMMVGIHTFGDTMNFALMYICLLQKAD